MEAQPSRWELRTCGCRGHVIHVPDETELADRLSDFQRLAGLGGRQLGVVLEARSDGWLATPRPISSEIHRPSTSRRRRKAQRARAGTVLPGGGGSVTGPRRPVF